MYFTLGVWLGLLGYCTIYILQFHKRSETISNYGENFVFTYIGEQLVTQSFITVIKPSAVLICI